MSNFIPNEIMKCVPRDPPCILKSMLNRIFNNHKKHGYKEVDNVRLDEFRNECQKVVGSAKLSHLAIMGNTFDHPNTSQV